MDDYIISDDIYKECLSQKELSYQISEDLYKESLSIDGKGLKAEIGNSYKSSDRFWILQIGTAYKNFWKGWVKDGELRLKVSGFKYLKAYPDLTSMKEEYEQLHPDRKGITVRPPAYYDFAYHMLIGDIVIACTQSEIIGWGIIESNYIYSPTRAHGKHYRKVAWNKIKMPFIFSRKRPFIYQIPKEETFMLKDKLMDKILNSNQPIPLPFETEEISHPIKGLGNKQTLCLLNGIISSLLLAKR